MTELCPFAKETSVGHITVWKSLQCALTTVATAEIDVKTVYSK